ncbi:MAG TPA: low temperature requirement protein A [Baekduia sp.]|uniref:low temperature requirement protein A n=1 Tax=Baekduia sp. TaxID=2600305 RepID=UPI002CBDB8DE|nr:low temperature requirement protein A [Baekduia sp.]HMJ32568.1 low temperature requirement protein A [Baekduia sp.]
MKAIFASSVRAGNESRSVTPLELFFDLVYVFAVSQLSHHLVEHFDVRTGIETLVLALAVVYAWYMTAWLSNWLSPEHRPVQALLLTIMLASLLMSSAIGDAFTDRAWLFVVPYVAIQVGRASFATVTFTSGSNQRIHFVNVLAWESATSVLWIAGALADGDARLVPWAIAVVVTYAGVALYHPIPGRPSHLAAPIGPDAAGAHSDLSGEHLLERLRLFFLIALGETLLTTGTAFAAEPVALGPLVAFVNSFVASVALWFCYFQRAEGAGLQASEASADPSGVASLGTQILTLMVLALIAIAVADEFAIANPGDEPGPGYLVLTFGGPALFLLGQLYFMRRVGAQGLRFRALAVLALAVLAIATSGTSLLAASIAATVVLVAVAMSDRRPVAAMTVPAADLAR